MNFSSSLQMSRDVAKMRKRIDSLDHSVRGVLMLSGVK